MISIFYNKNNLNDTLMVMLKDCSSTKIESNEKFSIIYSNNDVIGINIFNFSYYKNLPDGFIYPNDELILIIKNITNIDLIQFRDKNFVVGKVIKCESVKGTHLNYCDVDIKTKTLNIVCGASNVKEGMFVVVAMIGTFMPNGFYIKKNKIQGIESFGMLCSLQELNINSEKYNKEGIISVNDESKWGELFFDVYSQSN